MSQKIVERKYLLLQILVADSIWSFLAVGHSAVVSLQVSHILFVLNDFLFTTKTKKY